VVAFSALTMRTPAVPAASIRGRSHAGPPVDFAHRRSLRNKDEVQNERAEASAAATKGALGVRESC